MTENSFETLDIYIDYDQLKAQDLAKLLSNLSFISDKISQDYFLRFEKSDELPTLDIDTMHTGGSIKFKLIEAWKVKMNNNESDDIVISIPRKIGVPLVVGFLLVTTAIGYLEVRKLWLEVQELENKVEQVVLSKALGMNNESENRDKDIFKLANHYIDHKIPEIKPVLMDTVKFVLNNPHFTKFTVNDIELKDRSDDEHNEHRGQDL